MGLFGDRLCEYCGEKSGFFSGHIFKDDKEICKNCLKKIPSKFREYAYQMWKYEDYVDCMDFLAGQKEKRKKFMATTSYGSIYLDEVHEYVVFQKGRKIVDNNGRLLSESFVYEIKDLEAFEVSIINGEVREGIIKNKVVGDVSLVYLVGHPNIEEKIIVNNNVKCPADIKGIINKKVSCSLPEECQNVVDELMIMWNRARNCNN